MTRAAWSAPSFFLEVFTLRGARFLHATSARLDLDPAELRALALGQRKFEYSVLHQGPDMLVVDILVQFELPKVVSDIVLSV